MALLLTAVRCATNCKKAAEGECRGNAISDLRLLWIGVAARPSLMFAVFWKGILIENTNYPVNTAKTANLLKSKNGIFALTGRQYTDGRDVAAGRSRRSRTSSIPWLITDWDVMRFHCLEAGFPDARGTALGFRSDSTGSSRTCHSSFRSGCSVELRACRLSTINALTLQTASGPA